MKTHIVITAIPNPRNLGSMAVIESAKQAIEKSLPNTDLIFLSTYYLNSENLKLYQQYKIEPVNYTIFKKSSSRINTLIFSGVRAILRLFESIVYRIFGVSINGIFSRCDVVVDLSTESLNDLYGIGMPLFTIFNITLWLISGKPVILCAASIGPFKNRLLVFLVKLVLNKLSVISVREHISKKYLTKLGIVKPKIFVTADFAFLLDPAPSTRIKEILKKEHFSLNKDPIIGLAPSQLIHIYAFPNINNRALKYQKYVDLIVELINYVVEKIGCTVILIPHVTLSTYDNSQDDRIIISKILQKVANKQKVKALQGEYLPDEIKGIIGSCDMFIGCRMHAVIASLSMYVPTLAIGYGTKFMGVVGQMLNQEEWLIQIEHFSFEEILALLKAKIDCLWEKRIIVRNNLSKTVLSVKALALSNCDVIKNFLENKQKK